LGLPLVESGEESPFGIVDSSRTASRDVAARCREFDDVLAPVVAVRAALDQPASLQVVDEGDHGRAVDAQELSDLGLGALLLIAEAEQCRPLAANLLWTMHHTKSQAELTYPEGLLSP
jgi:hypothetical protein